MTLLADLKAIGADQALGWSVAKAMLDICLDEIDVNEQRIARLESQGIDASLAQLVAATAMRIMLQRIAQAAYDAFETGGVA